MRLLSEAMVEVPPGALEADVTQDGRRDLPRDQCPAEVTEPLDPPFPPPPPG